LKTIQLNNGVEMPLLGFGVFQITDLKECEESVLTALQRGYRLIDTAAGYGNEAAVGKAIRRSNLARQEVFISSKVWITHDGYEETMASFKQSLKKLQTDYLDLYLVHMPYGDYHGSWRAMEELYKAGKIRAIGVCNFLADRLTDLILTHEIAPAINQMETHPFNQQKELRQLMSKNNIKLMAWGPFAEGQNNIFSNETLFKIGKKYGKTTAQVILRWLKEEDIIAIPKSVHANRIKENFAIADFSLSQEDKEQISQLDKAKPLILNITALSEVYRLHGLA